MYYALILNCCMFLLHEASGVNLEYRQELLFYVALNPPWLISSIIEHLILANRYVLLTPTQTITCLIVQ